MLVKMQYSKYNREHGKYYTHTQNDRLCCCMFTRSIDTSDAPPRGFQGWWRLVTGRPGTLGYNGQRSTGSLIRNTYIFIDTSTTPNSTVREYGGTQDMPHPLVVGYETTSSTVPAQYYFRSPTELVRITDLNGTTPSLSLRFQGPTLKLVDCDHNYLVATSNSQAPLDASLMGMGVYTRVIMPAPHRASFHTE